MGTNRRYGDRQMDRRRTDTVMRHQEPSTLSAAELDLDSEPLTRAPVPRPVSAWVRYGDAAFQVDGVAVAWTEHAVAIKWPAPGGAEHRAWVWASAVRPRR